MASEAKYAIVGRYMEGSTVNGYHLLMSDGNSRRFSRDQVIYLVGKGDVANCKGQIYKDEVLLRGVGVNINDLPVVNERTGSMKNTENLGKVARGATNEQVLSQLKIVGKLVQGSKTIGFTVENTGKLTKDISRKQAEELAEQMKIRNARIQEYQGRKIMRLVGEKMEDLPITKDVPVKDAEIENTAEVKKQHVVSRYTKIVANELKRKAYTGKMLYTANLLKSKIDEAVSEAYPDEQLKSGLVVGARGTGFEFELHALLKHTNGKVVGMSFCLDESYILNVYWENGELDSLNAGDGPGVKIAIAKAIECFGDMNN